MGTYKQKQALIMTLDCSYVYMSCQYNVLDLNIIVKSITLFRM